ncbi:MarR family transcriptional regulator [Nakamurella silvestris]|nr:MarR family transcriptional regulator [Nakamurella silvestris]
MSGGARLANEAWEAMFRAQVVLMRSFAAEDIWGDLAQNEYDVLYTLSKVPEGLSMVEVNRNILMTQAGISRLVNRLVERGLIDRCVDPADRRATRMLLTPQGRELQRSVGRRHAASVTSAMTKALTTEELSQLRALARKITIDVEPIDVRHPDHHHPHAHRGTP